MYNYQIIHTETAAPFRLPGVHILPMHSYGQLKGRVEHESFGNLHTETSPERMAAHLQLAYLDGFSIMGGKQEEFIIVPPESKLPTLHPGKVYFVEQRSRRTQWLTVHYPDFYLPDEGIEDYRSIGIFLTSSTIADIGTTNPRYVSSFIQELERVFDILDGTSQKMEKANRTVMKIVNSLEKIAERSEKAVDEIETTLEMGALERKAREQHRLIVPSSETVN
jgi:hypothetical protein